MKVVFYIVVVICIFANSKSYAQEYFQVSPRSKSLAGMTTCLSDGWSVFGNQAGLSDLDDLNVGVSYSNYFLLKELSVKSAYAAFPVDNNIFAVSYYRYGYHYYNENKIGIAYSKKLVPGFSAGLQFNYFFIHLSENDKSPGFFCIEGGLQYAVNPNLVFGMHCFNPFQSGVTTSVVKYKLPCLFRFGAGTRIASVFWLYGEVENDLKNDFQTRFGIEYQVMNNFQLRGGVTGNNNLYAFGFSYQLKRFIADFSWQYTYRLGSTPSVAISYRLR